MICKHIYTYAHSQSMTILYRITLHFRRVGCSIMKEERNTDGNQNNRTLVRVAKLSGKPKEVTRRAINKLPRSLWTWSISRTRNKKNNTNQQPVQSAMELLVFHLVLYLATRLYVTTINSLALDLTTGSARSPNVWFLKWENLVSLLCLFLHTMVQRWFTMWWVLLIDWYYVL